MALARHAVAAAAGKRRARRSAPGGIEFSNPLDEGVFDPAWVQITPELPGAEISASGNGISIRGASKGRTTYQVTLRADLRDVFGQTLERDASVSFEVGSAQPMMAVPDGSMLVLDPAGRLPTRCTPSTMARSKSKPTLWPLPIGLLISST
jgi:hypothetical protein